MYVQWTMERSEVVYVRVLLDIYTEFTGNWKPTSSIVDSIPWFIRIYYCQLV